MSKCPSSGNINECLRSHFVEWFAITTTFLTIQFLAAKYFQKPTRVPVLLGSILPLSYYTFTVLDHLTKPSDKVTHGTRSECQRGILIFLVTFLIIRSYQNTHHALNYRWGIITLITAKFMTHLPQLPKSQS